MKSFRKFSFFTTIVTYCLIFIGGLVRVSGAGLGCPDWPTCFGRWIPPTSLDQVPPEMVDQFNLTLAWIEYSNRVCGMLIGLLILATAIWAILKFRDNKKILYSTCSAAILTALIGLQGGKVISSLLEPVVITVHMLLALLIVSLMIYATFHAYYAENSEKPIEKLTTKLSGQIKVLWIVGFIQILLGTQVRSLIELASREFPDLTSLEWLSKVGMFNHLHMTVGIFVVAYTWHVAVKLLKQKDKLSLLTHRAVLFMAAAVTVQLVIGITFLMVATQPITQVFHLWVASLYIGSVLLIYISVKRQEEA